MIQRPRYKIIIKAVNKPPQGLIKEIDTFRKLHWGPTYFSKEDRQEKFYSPVDIYIIAYINSQMVGVTNLYVRQIAFNDGSLKLGGIGGVVVHRSYRRQGIATRMMKKSLQTFREVHIDLAFMVAYPTKLERLYCTFGFIPMKVGYKFRGKSGKIYDGKRGRIVKLRGLIDEHRIVEGDYILDIGEGNI